MMLSDMLRSWELLKNFEQESMLDVIKFEMSQ
jgi:hypothetical protein